jgi:hypothetical protein
MTFAAPICQFIRLAASGLNVAKEVSEVHNQQGAEKALSMTSIAMRSLAIGLNAAGVGAHIEGASLLTEEHIKIGEVVVRSMGVVPHVINNVIDCVSRKKSVLQATESAVISFTSIVRAGLEEQALYFHHLATLPDEERKFPVYTGNEDEWHLDHWESLSVEQCHVQAGNYEVAANVTSGLELAGELKAYSCVLGTLVDTYQNVIDQLYPPVPPPPPAPAVALFPAPEDHIMPHAEPVDILSHVNLAGLSLIPQALHDDPLFKKFRCLITLNPIRHPVKDPTNRKTIYERSAIVQWLAQHHTSPATRLPLRVEELMEMPVLKGKIDARVADYQKRIERAIRKGQVLLPSYVQLRAIRGETQIEETSDDEGGAIC